MRNIDEIKNYFHDFRKILLDARDLGLNGEKIGVQRVIPPLDQQIRLKYRFYDVIE